MTMIRDKSWSRETWERLSILYGAVAIVAMFLC